MRRGTPHRRWTVAERDYLNEWYTKQPVAITAEHLGRSEESVRQQASQMGLDRSGGSFDADKVRERGYPCATCGDEDAKNGKKTCRCAVWRAWFKVTWADIRWAQNKGKRITGVFDGEPIWKEEKKECEN